MANVLFKLRNAKATKPQSIVLVYNGFAKGDKLTHPTGFKAAVNQWNENQQKVNDKIENTRKNEINAGLTELKAAFEVELMRRIREKEPATKESLKQWLNEYQNPKPKEAAKDISLHGYFKAYLKAAPNKINTATGKPITYTTVRKYHQCYNELLNYEKKYKTVLTWESINSEFYNNFIALLHGKNQRNNNIGKHIKTLKLILEAATVDGINKNTYFKNRKFTALSSKVENIYLTEPELKTLFDLDLSQNRRLEKVRDLFLIGCYTGLRYSDFSLIKPENITPDNGGKYITIEQKKVQQTVKIPVLPITESILTKYAGKLPKAPTNQIFNKYIKEVCELAAINSPCTLHHTTGGKRITTTTPKYLLVKTHTARRSFATNMTKRGINPYVIMSITGHATLSAFEKYLVMNQTEKAEQFTKEFFKHEPNI
jgi:integrase